MAKKIVYDFLTKETVVKDITSEEQKDFDIGMSHIKVPIISGYIRTSIGGFLNHSDNPNCELCLELDWDDYKTYNVYTTKR